MDTPHKPLSLQAARGGRRDRSDTRKAAATSAGDVLLEPRVGQRQRGAPPQDARPTRESPSSPDWPSRFISLQHPAQFNPPPRRSAHAHSHEGSPSHAEATLLRRRGASQAVRERESLARPRLLGARGEGNSSRAPPPRPPRPDGSPPALSRSPPRLIPGTSRFPPAPEDSDQARGEGPAGGEEGSVPHWAVLPKRGRGSASGDSDWRNSCGPGRARSGGREA